MGGSAPPPTHGVSRTCRAKRGGTSTGSATSSRRQSPMSASARDATRSSASSRPAAVGPRAGKTGETLLDVDLVIVGGGPCGLAAAVAAQRAGLRPLVLEGEAV